LRCFLGSLLPPLRHWVGLSLVYTSYYTTSLSSNSSASSLASSSPLRRSPSLLFQGASLFFGSFALHIFPLGLLSRLAFCSFPHYHPWASYTL
jgi:hypothetical protein